MPTIPQDCPACETPHSAQEWYSLGMVCGRCNKHTGDNHQGHYWGRCNVTNTWSDFHFCCPDDCELG